MKWRNLDFRIQVLVVYWLVILILVLGWVFTRDIFGFLVLLLFCLFTLPLGLILPGYLHGKIMAVPIAGIVFAVINSYIFCIIATVRLKKKS